MSSAYDVQDVDVYQSTYITLYCDLAAFTIVVYDWLINMDQEIKFIWNPRNSRTTASLLYGLARYGQIAYFAIIFATINPMALTRCQGLAWTGVILRAIVQTFPAVFSALRVYALSVSHRIPVALITLSLSLVLTVLNVVLGFKWQYIVVLPSPTNCTSITTLQPEQVYMLSIIARSALVVADLIVTIVTWRQTYQTYKIFKRDLHCRSSFARVMLFDGSIYFIVLALMNILHLTFTGLAQNLVDFDTRTSYVVTFTDPFTSILLARFILDLRRTDHMAGQTSSLFTEPQFCLPSNRSLPDFVAPFAGPIQSSLNLPCSYNERDAVECDGVAEARQELVEVEQDHHGAQAPHLSHGVIGPALAGSRV